MRVFLLHTGRRRFHLRHLNGRLVDLLRHHARVFGLPVQYPRRRSLAHHQGGQREAKGQGCGVAALLLVGRAG